MKGKGRQKGMALALTAVMLPVIVLVLAYAIDMGIAQTAQSRLESAVNQAADLGARRLPDEEGARETAESATRIALADVANLGSDFQVRVQATPESVSVSASMMSNSYFGRFAGLRGYPLAATTRRVAQTAPVAP